MRATLIYGCSASGKSTMAQEFIDKGYVHIERDRIRFDIVQPGGDWTTWKFDKKEKLVTKIWNEQLANAAFEGKNVVISDTLLTESKRNAVVDLLVEYGYDISVYFCYAPLDALIERDAARAEMSVGKDVILRQWNQLYGGDV